MERARLTHKLAKMKEEEGNIIEAANIIQELQVETYGSMEKREKVKTVTCLYRCYEIHENKYMHECLPVLK